MIIEKVPRNLEFLLEELSKAESQMLHYEQTDVSNEKELAQAVLKYSIACAKAASIKSRLERLTSHSNDISMEEYSLCSTTTDGKRVNR